MSPRQVGSLDYRFHLSIRGEELGRNGGIPGTDGEKLRLLPERSGENNRAGGFMGAQSLEAWVAETAEALVTAQDAGTTWSVFRERAGGKYALLVRKGRSATVTWSPGVPPLLALLRTSDIPSPAMAELAWGFLRGVCKAG